MIQAVINREVSLSMILMFAPIVFLIPLSAPLAGLGGGAMYFYLNPDELPEWPAKSRLGRDLQSTTVYKWLDASGEWHISDQKPAGNI